MQCDACLTLLVCCAQLCYRPARLSCRQRVRLSVCLSVCPSVRPSHAGTDSQLLAVEDAVLPSGIRGTLVRFSCCVTLGQLSTGQADEQYSCQAEHIRKDTMKRQVSRVCRPVGGGPTGHTRRRPRCTASDATERVSQTKRSAANSTFF